MTPSSRRQSARNGTSQIADQPVDNPCSSAWTGIAPEGTIVHYGASHRIILDTDANGYMTPVRMLKRVSGRVRYQFRDDKQYLPAAIGAQGYRIGREGKSNALGERTDFVSAVQSASSS